MKEIKLNKETTLLIEEINSLLNDLRDYKPTHECKLGINPFNINDLEKIYNREIEKLENPKKFYLTSELKEIWKELEEEKDEVNLMVLSATIYFKAMQIKPYGTLSSKIFLKVSKEILVAYNIVFKDTDFMDTFNKYHIAVTKTLDNEESFINLMLEIVKESLIDLKNK